MEFPLRHLATLSAYTSIFFGDDRYSLFGYTRGSGICVGSLDRMSYAIEEGDGISIYLFELCEGEMHRYLYFASKERDVVSLLFPKADKVEAHIISDERLQETVDFMNELGKL